MRKIFFARAVLSPPWDQLSVSPGQPTAVRIEATRRVCDLQHRVGSHEPELKEESAMATARELMSQGVECVNSTETLVEAARKMRDLDVGALPICGEDQRLKGMLTDRDIVVKCIAEGKDPNSLRAADLAQGKPVTIGADDSAEETLRTMAKYQVRRLPVIDGHQLVGIVAQADVARALPNEVVGQVLEEVSEK
jgi:CBS domain-containing protein